MPNIPDLPDLLRLIDERSVAFRAAVAAAPDLAVQVPTCPEWMLRDLVEHLGAVQRGWAATVAAGPSDLPLPRTPPDAPDEREALLSWSAESTTQLLDALREAGPDRGCWTWWSDSQSPQTSGAVARHQVQEAAVHTYDAQACVGSPSPLPEEVALDGVDEFLATSCATTSPWPHEPAVVEYQATEGPAWRLALGAAGGRPTRMGPEPAAGAPADASLRGTAGELVLALYGRVPIGALRAEGDGRVFDLLLAWDPED